MTGTCYHTYPHYDWETGREYKYEFELAAENGMEDVFARVRFEAYKMVLANGHLEGVPVTEEQLKAVMCEALAAASEAYK